MAANDHIAPQQLKLFMTGTELKESITGSIDRNPIGGFGRSMDQMWDQKRKESKRTGVGHGSGTHASLKERGWVGPGPELFHKRTFEAIPEFDKDELEVSDAHHRIAAAADIEKTSKGKRNIWIPTTNRSEYPSLTREEKFKKFNQDEM